MLHSEALSLPEHAVLNGHVANDHAPKAFLGSRMQADEWFRREALAAPPADLADPFTLSWFVALEYHRYHLHARWLAQALEFSRHNGETVLALGYGLGSDWVQYARAGAQVIVGCPDAEQLAITRQHFALRGLQGTFLHCPEPRLPLPSATADLACLNQLFAENAHADAWWKEIYRVLKPGGKLILIEILPSYSFRAGHRLRHQFMPLLAAFENIRVRRHHLRRSELSWMWRWLPRRWLERFLGRFLLLKAHKPIHCQHTLRLAA